MFKDVYYSQAFEKFVRQGDNAIEPMAKRLSLSEPIGSFVVDLGCGIGNNSFYLAKKGFIVLGIDSDPDALKYAKRVGDYLGNDYGASFMVGFAQDLGLPNASVDVVLCTNLLNVLEDETGVLSETSRVLREGSRLYLSNPQYGKWAAENKSLAVRISNALIGNDGYFDHFREYGLKPYNSCFASWDKENNLIKYSGVLRKSA